MTLTAIAKQLNMAPKILEKESLKYFLLKKLLETETEFFTLARKYKVKSIKEFDSLIKAGKLHESDETREDFFRIDYLEAKRDTLKKLIRDFNQ